MVRGPAPFFVTWERKKSNDFLLHRFLVNFAKTRDKKKTTWGIYIPIFTQENQFCFHFHLYFIFPVCTLLLVPALVIWACTLVLGISIQDRFYLISVQNKFRNATLNILLFHLLPVISFSGFGIGEFCLFQIFKENGNDKISFCLELAFHFPFLVSHSHTFSFSTFIHASVLPFLWCAQSPIFSWSL